ncbi:hypothetical protein Bca52824_048156 [Brassica carinata]|uniref:Uncharacterized protein n=1 Tax=Brassica carinata TaxID=52824 RepID=A0A8X7RIL8_BRACI|nr:hypothetical protein Bca52824_048156 [Brassica carinata]
MPTIELIEISATSTSSGGLSSSTSTEQFDTSISIPSSNTIITTIVFLVALETQAFGLPYRHFHQC